MKRDFNFKDKNIKTKLLSVIVAIVLWLYVVEIVDPSEKKTIVDIPITITNISELNEGGYDIYPKENLYTEITVEGSLSEIQKLNKNNVHVFGTVQNPVEGKNIVELSTNISSRINRDLKDNTFVVNLEKIVTKKVPIRFVLPSSEKNNVNKVESSQDYMVISGPRSLIDEVQYLSGNIDYAKPADETEKTQRVKLIAYNKNDMEITVPLEKKYLNVEIIYNVTKTVPVKIDYAGEDYDINSYKTNPDRVVIRGSSDHLGIIDYVYTKTLYDNDMKSIDGTKVTLNVPDGVSVDSGNFVTISESKDKN